jgi:hypothetical protein
MKIKEVIVEGHDGNINELDSDHAATSNGMIRMRDKGGYDRTYHLNRIMMATAMADGKSKKAVDMPQSSYFEKYNTAHPYTEEEHNMMHQAFNTVDTEFDVLVKHHKSAEHKDTHKVSPVPAKKKNRYGV